MGRNYISGLASIEAVGGYGVNKGYGGAGGIIVMDGTMISLSVEINGGRAGTYYSD